MAKDNNAYGGIDMQLRSNGGNGGGSRNDAPRPGAAKSLAKYSMSNSTAQRGEAKAPSAEVMNYCR